MELRKHFERIGTTMDFHDDGLVFAVNVLNVKTAFGRVDYKIMPITGSGTKWVSETSLTNTKQEEKS